jgi:hypothetical protein
MESTRHSAVEFRRRKTMSLVLLERLAKGLIIASVPIFVLFLFADVTLSVGQCLGCLFAAVLLSGGLTSLCVLTSASHRGERGKGGG